MVPPHPAAPQIDSLNTVKAMFRSAKLQPKIGAQGMVWVLLKANAPMDVRGLDMCLWGSGEKKKANDHAPAHASSHP